MPTGGSVAFWIVTALSTGNPEPSPDFGEQWVVEIDLFGEYLTQDAAAQPAGGLHLLRGVSHYPRLGEGVLATASTELREIYNPPHGSSVRTGTLHQDSTLPAYLITDEHLGKHHAILAQTRPGKP